MMTADRILLCGLNGAGKSTLGRALAQATGYVFRDIEDYYFPKCDADNPYRTARSKEEVTALLLDDLQRHPRMILAAVRPAYGTDIPRLLTRAIHIVVPRDIRLQRIRERSHRKFGARMLKGGDLYDAEERFFAVAAARTECYVTDWLQETGLPVTELDGTLPTDENVRRLTEMMNN